MVDQLSDVLDLIEVRAVLSGSLTASGPWVSRGMEIGPLKFLAVVTGQARLTTDGMDGPLDLLAGDVVLLNNRSRLELRGGLGSQVAPGGEPRLDGPLREVSPAPILETPSPLMIDGAADDVVVGGHIDLNPAGRALLQQSLPPVAHVRGSADSAHHLRGSLHRLFDEVAGGRVGAGFAVRQHAQLLLLHVLRTYVDQAELPPGWLRLVTDERLRPALTLVHGDPARAWRLEDLARAAAMSRTTFAERFRRVAGTPPLTYLTRWRMTLAQRALRDDNTSVGRLAADLGYASESAFSTAFKRELGESPLRFRSRSRRESEGRESPSPDRAAS